MKFEMGVSFMAQFVSIVDILHPYEVVSVVSYLMLIMLPRLSMQTLVRSVIDQPCKDRVWFIVKLTLYTVEFGIDSRTHPVFIAQSSGSTTAGETGYSLMCSAILLYPVLLSDLPTPTFQWFFGPYGNGSLPICATPTETFSRSNSTGITYTSTLLFSRLNQSLHTGNYTCRIGAGRLANNIKVTVNGIYDYECHK